ncbi:Platelet-activating factor acetylhydrolase [Phlyctochytrium bullatum]|nr:Platelet-activating factor acetylhydrolase [Phlyctochytrium bullatum]
MVDKDPAVKSTPDSESVFRGEEPPAPVTAVDIKEDELGPRLPELVQADTDPSSSASSSRSSISATKGSRPASAGQPFKSLGVSHFEIPKSDGFPYGLFAAIFYPCDPSGKKRTDRASWLPGPNKFYVQGYGDFVHSPRFLTNTIMNALMKHVKMAAYTDSPILIPSELPVQLPVAIFSHGLGGNRTTYSSLVGNLCSRGFVTIAIEHRDGSACTTGFNNYSETIGYEQPSKEKMLPGETKDDYLKRFRTGQVAQRVKEVEAAVRVVEALGNTGELPGPNLLGETLPDLKGKLDLDCMVMFFHWRENIEAVRELLSISRVSSSFAMVLGTKHQDVSDFPSLAPRFMRAIKVAGNASPEQVQNAYDRMMVGWLSHALQEHNAIANVLAGDNVAKASSGTLDISQYAEPDFVLVGDEAWSRLMENIPETWEDTKK